MVSVGLKATLLICFACEFTWSVLALILMSVFGKTTCTKFIDGLETATFICMLGSSMYGVIAVWWCSNSLSSLSWFSSFLLWMFFGITFGALMIAQSTCGFSSQSFAFIVAFVNVFVCACLAFAFEMNKQRCREHDDAAHAAYIQSELEQARQQREAQQPPPAVPDVVVDFT